MRTDAVFSVRNGDSTTATLEHTDDWMMMMMIMMMIIIIIISK